MVQLSCGGWRLVDHAGARRAHIDVSPLEIGIGAAPGSGVERVVAGVECGTAFEMHRVLFPAGFVEILEIAELPVRLHECFFSVVRAQARNSWYGCSPVNPVLT